MDSFAGRVAMWIRMKLTVPEKRCRVLIGANDYRRVL